MLSRCSASPNVLMTFCLPKCSRDVLPPQILTPKLPGAWGKPSTHRFLKASSCRSRGSIPVMSGWRKLPEEPRSSLPKISTHSKEFITWKHLSRVTRKRLRFTPGLCKACFLASPKSIVMSSSSCVKSKKAGLSWDPQLRLKPWKKIPNSSSGEIQDCASKWNLLELSIIEWTKSRPSPVSSTTEKCLSTYAPSVPPQAFALAAFSLPTSLSEQNLVYPLSPLSTNTHQLLGEGFSDVLLLWSNQTSSIAPKNILNQTLWYINKYLDAWISFKPVYSQPWLHIRITGRWSLAPPYNLISSQVWGEAQALG